jgi:hypothetical protein
VLLFLHNPAIEPTNNRGERALRPAVIVRTPASPFPIDRTIPDACPVSAAEAVTIYRSCMQRWHIRERFPQPDWSIVDLLVARHLLSQGKPAVQIQAILRLASAPSSRRKRA